MRVAVRERSLLSSTSLLLFNSVENKNIKDQIRVRIIRVVFLDVGVEPHDVTEVMPDIMEIRKKESPGEDSFYNDPDINQMSIQVRRS